METETPDPGDTAPEDAAGPSPRRLPWVRIWAEAPVIIVSILLAFAIEAWWSEAQEGREVDQYLEALLPEFEAARAQLDSVSDFNRRSIAATHVMVRLTPERAAAIPPDSALSLFGSMMGTLTFDPSLGVMTAMQNAGVLDDVPDLELRGLLGGWPGLVEDSREDVYPLWETSMLTVDRWAERDLAVTVFELAGGIAGPEEASRFLVEIARDPETLNHLASRGMFHRIYQDEVDGMVGRLDRILELLRAHVDD